MSTPIREQTTELLEAAPADATGVAQRLLPLVYGELHELAERFLRREPRDHTLQPTALVHEAFVRLVDQRRVSWQGRTHFLAIGAQAMRRILVDHARARQAAKRGGGRERIDLQDHLKVSASRTEDLLAVDEALHKLAKIDARQAAIVEMRFFAGMTIAEVAEQLGVSRRTVEAEWTMIRAWLRRELAETQAS